jgi:two-component sensor histidine kinase
MRVSVGQRSLIWLGRPAPGSAGAYAIAIFLVVIAGLIRWGLSFVSEDIFLFAAFYPAILFATYIGGPGVGIFAAMLGAAIAWGAFVPHPLGAGVQIKLLAYLVASTLIIWGADHYRRIRKRLEDEENFRKLAVEELAHRLKNKLVTVQSIISFQLREEPQVRDGILRRLSALSATDDLIIAAQGKGARIGDIITAELRPYDVARISIEGPDISLPPKLALTMALLFHELATNAAKYGALSQSVGRISVRWSYSNARLNLEWRESEGPAVSAPNHHGFGTRLFLRALAQFDGKVDATFASTGFVCALNVPLSDSELTGVLAVPTAPKLQPIE